MTTTRLEIDPPKGFTPQIGRFVNMLEDTRRRTKRYVEGLSAEQLAWHPNGEVESIGTILLHWIKDYTRFAEFSYDSSDEYF